MKRVYQNRFGPPGKYCKEGGNCFGACVASILNMELKDMPEFISIPDYTKMDILKICDFFHDIKINIGLYHLINYKIDKESIDIFGKPNLNKHYILCGSLPYDNKCHHARVAIGDGFTIVHDPNPNLFNIEFENILYLFAERL